MAVQDKWDNTGPNRQRLVPTITVGTGATFSDSTPAYPLDLPAHLNSSITLSPMLNMSPMLNNLSIFSTNVLFIL